MKSRGVSLKTARSSAPCRASIHAMKPTAASISSHCRSPERDLSERANQWFDATLVDLLHEPGLGLELHAAGTPLDVLEHLAVVPDELGEQAEEHELRADQHEDRREHE